MRASVSPYSPVETAKLSRSALTARARAREERQDPLALLDFPGGQLVRSLEAVASPLSV